MRMGVAFGDNLLVSLPQGVEVHRFVDTDHGSRVARYVVEDEVPEIAVHLRVCLPVTCVSVVLVLGDLVKTRQIVNRLKVHSKSIFGSGPRYVAFELLELLCSNLEGGEGRRETDLLIMKYVYRARGGQLYHSLNTHTLVCSRVASDFPSNPHTMSSPT